MEHFLKTFNSNESGSYVDHMNGYAIKATKCAGAFPGHVGFRVIHDHDIRGSFEAVVHWTKVPAFLEKFGQPVETSKVLWSDKHNIHGYGREGWTFASRRFATTGSVFAPDRVAFGGSITVGTSCAATVIEWRKIPFEYQIVDGRIVPTVSEQEIADAAGPLPIASAS